MPLYSKKSIDKDTVLVVWEISEPFDELINQVDLNPLSKIRVDKFTSEKRKVEFVCSRIILQEMGYSDFDLTYREDGAPLLKGKYISISHTSEFVAVIVSGKKIGLDIEKNRKQIFRISHKFISAEEANMFDSTSIEILSIIWNCKEAMFKLCDKTGIDFIKNLHVTSISLESSSVEGKLIFDNEIKMVKGKIDIFSNHTLVYLMIN